MIRSMTGFGAGRAMMKTDVLTVEIRSVNGKFCEVRARLPRELVALEASLVRRVKERLARGNIEVTVKRGAGAGGTLVPKVDEELAERLCQSLRSVQQRLGLQGDVTISDLLTVDGIVTLEEPGIDLEEASKVLGEATEEALSRLIEMREREGELLRADLVARVAGLLKMQRALGELAPEGLVARQERVGARIQELLGDAAVEPQRIAQEVAILAERSDIAEELTRLDSHLEQFKRLMGSDEPAGRRLDFLVQEMNREANTIASKASWLDSVEIVVEMKAEIERIREQIQNIE